MKTSPRSRSKRAVNLFANGRTLGRVVGYWTVYHVLFWHALFLYRCLEYHGGLPAGAQAVSFADLYADFAVNESWIIVCALGVLPLVAWDAMRLTNRMVGPLARFRHCLKLLSRGEPVAQVKIRRGDFLVELQDSFNEFLDSPYNTRRWSASPAAATLHPQTDDRPASGSDGELVLESLREIQASLWQVRAEYAPPEPVAMSPRAAPMQPGAAPLHSEVSFPSAAQIRS